MNHPAHALLPDRVVQTHLFGELRVPLASVVTFAAGIPGFEDSKEFALLPAAASGSYWLQSLSQANLAFFLVEARLLVPEAFGETPDALAVVTLPSGAESSATANLRAPILIDRAAGLGIQLIAIDDTFPMAHPFDVAALLQ